MNISIIGAGNMGGAVAIGLARAVSEGNLDAQIAVTARHEDSLLKFSGLNIMKSLDNGLLAGRSDVVIIAVKPWVVGQVLSDLTPYIKGKILICFAAGVKSEDLLVWAPGVSSIYKVIPNLAAEVCQSMTYVTRISAGAIDDQTVKTIFDSVGKTRFVSEKELVAGTMVASCGTAFAIRYIRASMEGGIGLGLRAGDALEAVLQTVKGAAILLEERGTHPEQEIDRVTTPGGITIKGLDAMEENGFTNAVIKGLKV